MNERIRELMNQAGIDVEAVENLGEMPTAIKFAELIVRECAELFPNVYVSIEHEHGHTPVVAADYIKQHFGVEE